jgi:hypothetical protein
MAIIDMHTNHISGKVGNKVYYVRNGKQLLRGKPAPRKTEPSIPELIHRSKFAFITKFLLPLNLLFHETFRSRDMLPFNKALSVNFNHVIPESYPDWRVDFRKLLLGQGYVSGLRDLSLSVDIPGHLMFIWNGKSRGRGATGHDQVYVAVYCENLNQWLIRLDACSRKNGSLIIDAEPLSGYPVHVYLVLTSDFWEGSSGGQYLGKVEIM